MIASRFLQLLTTLLERGKAGADPANSRLPALLEETYGPGELLGKKLRALRDQCIRFMQIYDDGPIFVLRAPARINLLGEHVDYVSYLPTSSLTFGSREHEMILFFRPSKSSQVRGSSSLSGSDSCSFSIAEVSAGTGIREDGAEWLQYLYSRPSPAPHWGNYAKGAIFFSRMKYGERIRVGCDFLIDSSIPSAGGASSSSALTVLAGAAIRRANGLPCNPLELARDSAKAEWFVGTRGGTMDHLTICLSRRDHLVHLSYYDAEPVLLPFPPNRFRFVTFYAHPADKSREVMLEYNERAAVARVIIPAIIQDWASSRPALYDLWRIASAEARNQSPEGRPTLAEILSNLPETLSLRELESHHPDAFANCAEVFHSLVHERLENLLKIRDRALHHLGEVHRVAEAAHLLGQLSGENNLSQSEAMDEGMRRVGRLLRESHQSLRDLYEVSTPRVDRLIAMIDSDPLVYGARLMGGGFGGNVLALTQAEHVPELVAIVQAGFFATEGPDAAIEGEIMISTPGDGMSDLPL